MGCGASSKSPQASEPITNPANPAPLLLPPPAASLPPINNATFTSNYQVLEEISRGPGFICKKCTHKTSGMTFSAKFLKKKILQGTYLNPAIMRRELLTLKSLTHPNLVKIVEFFDDENTYIIVQEYCKGGSLFEHVAKSEKFSETMVIHIMRQVLSAVNYCHERKVLHRDLSPDTILLEETSESTVIKVSDFGSLSFFDANKQLSGKFGTVYYCAPEVFDGLYDQRCDLWSCGVIMHILLVGFPPFQGVTDAEVRHSICEDIIPLHSAIYNSVSNPAKDLIHRLLIKDPQYRISGKEALSHPWFESEGKPRNEVHIMQVVDTMSRFKNICKLKDAIFNFICTHMLSVQDYKELRRIFEGIDQNGDGQLSRDEIRRQLAVCVPATTIEPRLSEIFTRVDTDHNDTIDYHEFIKATIDVAKVESKEVLRRTFQMFDKDANGFISCEELRMVLECGELDEGMDWSDLLKEADTNGDGVIDMMEFEALIQRKV